MLIVDASYYHKHFLMPDLCVKIHDLCILLSLVNILCIHK